MKFVKKSQFQSLKKSRIIGRLDIKGSNLIKGINFEGLKIIGSPIEFAEKYYSEGIDELIYIDTVATLYGRNNLLDLVKKVGEKVFIPIIVAGGIRTVADARNFLNAGADKVGVNTAAVNNPSILQEISSRFGREKTGKNVVEWAKQANQLGIGEILLTSIDKDGTMKGPDIELVKSIKEVIDVPLIVSGGIGKIDHIEDLFNLTHNYNLAIGSAIHNNKLKINQIKNYLKQNNFQINR